MTVSSNDLPSSSACGEKVIQALGREPSRTKIPAGEVEGVFGHLWETTGLRLLCGRARLLEDSDYQLMIDVAARAPD